MRDEEESSADGNRRRKQGTDEQRTMGRRKETDRKTERGGKGRDSWTGASANVLFKAEGVAAAS